LTFGKAKGFAITDANLKLAAVEDLGGGLMASFDYTLETGAQRGTTVTRADSGVGLSGGFGAVAIRNTRFSDLIASIGSAAISLPDGLYDSTGIVSRSAIDTVSYTTPAMNGFTGSFTFVELNEGNIDAAATNKSLNVIGLSYANGPLTVAAVMKSKPATAAASSGLTSKANTELAVSYDLGVAKVSYAFDGASAEGASSAAIGAFASEANARAVANLQTKSANGFSVTVPMGAFTLGMNYFKRDIAKVTEFGASYAFSKRTTLSASTGKKSGLAADLGFNGSQNRIRLAHTF
jgi:predicted porin